MGPNTFPTYSQGDDNTAKDEQMELEFLGDDINGNRDIEDLNSDNMMETNGNNEPVRETLTTLGPENIEEQENNLEERPPSEEEAAATTNPDNKGSKRVVRNDIEKKSSKEKPWYEKDPLAVEMYEVVKDIEGKHYIIMWELHSRLRKRGVDVTTSQVSRLAKKYLIFYDKKNGKNRYLGWNIEKYPPKPTEKPKVPKNEDHRIFTSAQAYFEAMEEKEEKEYNEWLRR